MALIIDIPKSKLSGYPKFSWRHYLLKQGFGMEFIKRILFGTHVTALDQWVKEIHESWVCKRLDLSAPGGPIIERRRLNHPSDLTRALKFSYVYFTRFMRYINLFERGEAKKLSDGMAVPVLLGTWEENLVGHVTEIFDDRMHVKAQEEVLRPYPKNVLSWELDFIDDSHIHRDFAVVGEPARCTGVLLNREDALKRIRARHSNIPVIFLRGDGEPITMVFTSQKGMYSAECDFNRYAYIIFKIIQEYYRENESTLKTLAQDDELHVIGVDEEWMWTVNTDKLLSMPVSKAFMSRRPDLHLLPEFKKKFPGLSVDRTTCIAI